MKSCFYTSFAGDRHRHYFNRAGAGTLKKSVRGDPLQAGGTLRREDALVYRSGLLNKTGPVEVTLRDKLNNFAHLFTKVEIRRKYSAYNTAPSTIGFRFSALEDQRPSLVVSLDGWAPVKKSPPGADEGEKF
jgi:hypothetical protein